MIKDMKTATINKGQITIPKEVRTAQFSEGSKVIILSFNDRIELRPVTYVEEKLGPALLSEASLAKDWLSKEDEQAWKDL